MSLCTSTSQTDSKSAVRGFTLVELLVVIGIIAVLIAMLMPSLRKVRESANKVACASNLRQMAVGLKMYTNDHKGIFPRGRGGNTMRAYDYHLAGPGTFNDDFAFLYAVYLRGSQSRDPVTIRSDIRNRTAKFFICPTNPRTLPDQRYSYIQCLFSAEDYKMTELKARSVARANPHMFPYGAAVFSDVIVPTHGGGTAFFKSFTNHIDVNKKGGAAGGNVAHLDGSVVWYDYDPNTSPNYPSYVGPLGLSGFNEIAWPSSAIAWRADGTTNKIYDTYLAPNGWNAVLGRSYKKTSEFLPPP